MKHSKEEKYILDALEKGKIKLSTPSKSEIAAIKSAADNTFKKDRSVTIRLYSHDFMGIQKKAMEMGLPYQTLISGLIHRYIEGDIKIKTA
jgi:predicted DNA binding CopG/RHH family protein